MKPPSDYPRASQLFTILAYDAEDGLFLTEDRSLAFGFICQPLSGADPAVADRVNVLLNQDWPVDTLVQVSLWTSPDIDATLALMHVRRIAQQQPFHKDMLRATVEFLGQGAQSALDGTSGIRLRRMQVLVTVKLPMAGAMPTENDIRRNALNTQSIFGSMRCFIKALPMSLTVKPVLTCPVKRKRLDTAVLCRMAGASHIGLYC